jgi:hypothetical protein
MKFRQCFPCARYACPRAHRGFPLNLLHGYPAVESVLSGEISVHGGKEKGSARTNFTQQPIKSLALGKSITMVSAMEVGDMKRSYASHTEISMLAKLHAQAFMAAHNARGAARVS